MSIVEEAFGVATKDVRCMTAPGYQEQSFIYDGQSVPVAHAVADAWFGNLEAQRLKVAVAHLDHLEAEYAETLNCRVPAGEAPGQLVHQLQQLERELDRVSGLVYGSVPEFLGLTPGDAGRIARIKIEFLRRAIGNSLLCLELIGIT